MCRRVCARYTHSCTMLVWITLLFQIHPNTIKRWLMTIVGYFLFLLSNNKSYNLRFCWRFWNKKLRKIGSLLSFWFQEKVLCVRSLEYIYMAYAEIFLCTNVSYSSTSNKDLVCLSYIWSNYVLLKIINS